MRLIDADAIEAKQKTIYMEYENVAVPTRVVPVSALHLAPTVDAVEVVRCKDCLNAMKITESERFKWNFRDDALQCGLIGHVVLPDGYCDGGVKADAEVEE